MEERLLSQLQFKKLNENAILPTRGTPGSAGWDLYYCGKEPLRIRSITEQHYYGGNIQKAPTGLAVKLPMFTYGAVVPRSGLAAKHGITVLNAPGTIDSDYRGEIIVLLVNVSHDDYTVMPGDRVAQLIVIPYDSRPFSEVDTLDETERGDGKFGSTGA